MANTKNDEKTLRELIDLEIATRIVCTKYENENRLNNYANEEVNFKFQKFNELYRKIFEQIENYLNANA